MTAASNNSRSAGGCSASADARTRGVQTRLSGQLQYRDGTVAAGPPTTWKGLNKPHRADRRWATAWSPEQISRRLVLDFPDDIDMRISHEAIYQALYIQGRGALTRALVQLCTSMGVITPTAAIKRRSSTSSSTPLRCHARHAVPPCSPTRARRG